MQGLPWSTLELLNTQIWARAFFTSSNRLRYLSDGSRSGPVNQLLGEFMIVLSTLTAEIVSQATRALTGQLFTEEQIKGITSHSVGKYLKELFPANHLDVTQRERIELAQSHIVEASTIMADMRTELDAQKETLEYLLGEIEEKKSTVKKYTQLAETSQGAVSAVRQELETTLRTELFRQSKAGRGTRRIASALLWITTLILGAALGSYFREVWGVVSSLLA
jgi:hypothetical protein